MKARYQKYTLTFKQPSGTSRGVLREKESWFIILEDGPNFGIGECGLLRGLSCDDRPDYEVKLQWACDHIETGLESLYQALSEFPSIQFGLEMAFASLAAKNPFILFPSKFTKGESAIPINGLIWMGSPDFMKSQIKERLKNGFRCIKMKIGAIEFETELELLRALRKEFSPEKIELRVDANGAFAPKEALEKLKRLSDLSLHSIEQPIRPNQWQEMADLCEKSPLPIALDEELIGIHDKDKRASLLDTISPQYIILKPSFIGGWKGSDTWVELAEKRRIGWWVTSALESNIGLNAISQYTYTKNSTLPQGLGTGSLYTNNLTSPLIVRGGNLSYNPELSWDLSALTV